MMLSIVLEGCFASMLCSIGPPDADVAATAEHNHVNPTECLAPSNCTSNLSTPTGINNSSDVLSPSNDQDY